MASGFQDGGSGRGSPQMWTFLPTSPFQHPLPFSPKAVPFGAAVASQLLHSFQLIPSHLTLGSITVS